MSECEQARGQSSKRPVDLSFLINHVNPMEYCALNLEKRKKNISNIRDDLGGHRTDKLKSHCYFSSAISRTSEKLPKNKKLGG